MNRKSDSLASRISIGVSFVRVGTSAATSSSFTPSIRSPKLTMHAIVSLVSGRVKCPIASRTRSGAARNRFTRPGSFARSWSSRSAYCASANSPIVNRGFARITSTRAADPRSLILGSAARTVRPPLGRAARLDGDARDATRARPPKPVADRDIRLDASASGRGTP